MLSIHIGLQCSFQQYEGILPHKDKIKLDTQPANSPDLNINDLGLFAALQACYECSAPKNGLELVEKVKEAHGTFPAKRIHHLFLTLQVLEYRVPVPFISEWERDLTGNAVEDAGYGYSVVCSLISYFSANWLLEGLFSVYPTFALKYGGVASGTP